MQIDGNPTRMCNKPAPYLHQKSANGPIDALMLMLLTKLVPNGTLKRCNSGINLINHDAKFALNITKSGFSALLPKIGANKMS